MDETSVKDFQLKLVSDSLNAKQSQNQFIIEFQNLYENDFKNFSNEYGLKMDVIENLDYILGEMRRIDACPELHSKTIGAIGGGFSSGKSSFINSFLTKKDVELAVGIKPVTAIPSYVVYGDEPKIVGVTPRDEQFSIESQMYKMISHDTVESFPLNKLINYVTVLVPMRQECLGNLCIIDTPGYNPAGTENTKSDLETAKAYIKDAQFLIWMVALGTNGTIPKSDLDFLKKLDFGKDETRPLYIVANKAELKKESDYDDILDRFEEALEDADLSWAGISAYSSRKGREYTFRKQTLEDFLVSQNNPNKKYGDLVDALDAVFDLYQTKVKNEFSDKRKKQQQVRSMLLDAMQSGNIRVDGSLSNKLEDGLNDLVRYFNAGNKDEKLKEISRLHENFLKCIDGFCDSAGIDKTRSTKDEKKMHLKKYCDRCGSRLSPNHRFCPKCGKSTEVENT